MNVDELASKTLFSTSLARKNPGSRVVDDPSICNWMGNKPALMFFEE
jgi:hypothetical protein